MRRFGSRHLFGSKAIALAAALALCSAAPVLAAKQDTAPNAPAQMQLTDDGPILVTPSGMTLYINSAEDTKSEKFKWQCRETPVLTAIDQQSGVGTRPVIGAQFTKSCLQKFPPFLADANSQSVGDFTPVDRPQGGKQWAYRGFPLYTSVKDHKPGDRNAAPVGAFGGGRRGGFVLALVPVDIPTGLKFSRRDEGLVLATAATDRPLYAPKDKHAQPDDGTFEPLLAPEVASVINADWSIIDAGAGRKQYAFKGKPLYAAPVSMSDWEIAKTGSWETVVYQKSAGRPSEIKEHLTLLGDVYTTKDGLTLYNYSCGGAFGFGGATSCDDPGDAAGYMVALCGVAEECAKRWHPYLAPANARPIGDWSIAAITYPMFTDPRGALYPPDAPRVKAWAYRGKPVYTYYDDKKPGDIWGNGTKGLWGSNFNAVSVPGHSALFE